MHERYFEQVRLRMRALPSIAEEKLFQSETTAELDAMIPSVLDKAFRGEL